MKYHHRLLFLFILFFVLFISFKILEPEIRDHREMREVVPEQDYVEDPEGSVQAEAAAKTAHVAELARQEAKRRAIIDRFLDMYDLDWNYQLTGGQDPFEVAATWVQPRSLHPEFAPEIGK